MEQCTSSNYHTKYGKGICHWCIHIHQSAGRTHCKQWTIYLHGAISPSRNTHCSSRKAEEENPAAWKWRASSACAHNHDYYLSSIQAVTDFHIGWMEAAVMKTINSLSIITQLVTIIATHELPLKTTSDNGPQFVSTEFQQYMENTGNEWQGNTLLVPGSWKSGVTKLNVAWGYPDFVQWGLSLEKGTSENSHDIQEYFTSKHRARTPAELLFGRRLCTKIPEVRSLAAHKLHFESHTFTMHLLVANVHRLLLVANFLCTHRLLLDFAGRCLILPGMLFFIPCESLSLPPLSFFVVNDDPFSFSSEKISMDHRSDFQKSCPFPCCFPLYTNLQITCLVLPLSSCSLQTVSLNMSLLICKGQALSAWYIPYHSTQCLCNFLENKPFWHWNV